MKKPTRQPRQLSAREELFVREYLKDENATRAATAAGYSAKTAYAQGSRLLRRVQVRRALDAARGKQLERVELSADRILRELMRIGLADVSQAFDETGHLKPLDEIPEDTRRALAGIETETIGEDGLVTVRKVKFWDKPKALELLGKHLKLFTDKVEVEANVQIACVNPFERPKPQEGDGA